MSITLETGMKLQGKAGAATAIVVTVFGVEASTSRAYKRLAQVTLGTGATAIYTAPASTQTIISAIVVQSIHAADQSCEIWCDATGTADANRVFKSTAIPAGGGADYDGSRWSMRDAVGRPINATQQITVPAQESTVVKTASPTALNFDHGLDVTDVAGVPRIDVDETELAVPLASLTGGANDDVAQRKSGAWTNRTLAQLRTDLYAFTFDTHANRIASSPVAGARWKETDTGLVYYYNGSSWVVEVNQGMVYKSADETVNNSAAVQNDDHLKFPIEANEVWLVKAWLLISAQTSSTPDYLCDWTGPASATASWGALGRSSDLTGLAWGASPALATNPIAIRTLAQTAAFAVLGPATIGQAIVGVFKAAGTAGTIQFRWAQNTATAEDTKTLAGSSLELTRLA